MKGEFKITSFTVIFFLLLTLFYPLIYKATVVNFDSEMIVKPLMNVKSFSSYLELRKQIAIFDIAPIRDMSHLIDINFFRSKDFNLDIVHNLCIWFITLLLISKNFKMWTISRPTAFIILLLLSIHPSILETVVWVSARKHLLATLFLVSAWHIEIKDEVFSGKCNKFLIFLLYLLSVLSWPILILYPIYYSINCYLNERKTNGHLILSICLLVTMTILAIINFYYYNNQFVQLLGLEKTQSHLSMGLSLLGIGRAFFQTIIPFYIAIAYGPSSNLCLLGLVLFPLFGYFLFLKLTRKDFFRFIILFLLPLVTVLVFPTAIFLMDTYIFFSTIILWMYLAKAIDGYVVRHSNFFLFLGLIILLVFYYKSSLDLKLRLNERAFVNHSYEIDKSCPTMGMHLIQKWEEGDLSRSIKEFQEFSELGCRKSNLQQIYLFAIFFDQRFSNYEKQIILKKHANSSFLASILLNSIDYKISQIEVIKNLNNLFKNNAGKVVHVPFKLNEDPVFIELNKKCENTPKVLSEYSECKEFKLNISAHYLHEQ